MEELRLILEEINPDIDYEKEEKLVDDKLLDSLAILTLAMKLEETYNITLTPNELTAKNLNSAAAILNLIKRLQGK